MSIYWSTYNYFKTRCLIRNCNLFLIFSKRKFFILSFFSRLSVISTSLLFFRVEDVLVLDEWIEELLKQKSSETVFTHKLKSYTAEFTYLVEFFGKTRRTRARAVMSEMTQNDMLLVATHTTRFSRIFDDLLSGSQVFLRRRKGLPNSRKIIIWEETRFFVIVSFFLKKEVLFNHFYIIRTIILLLTNNIL